MIICKGLPILVWINKLLLSAYSPLQGTDLGYIPAAALYNMCVQIIQVSRECVRHTLLLPLLLPFRLEVQLMYCLFAMLSCNIQKRIISIHGGPRHDP